MPVRAIPCRPKWRRIAAFQGSMAHASRAQDGSLLCYSSSCRHSYGRNYSIMRPVTFSTYPLRQFLRRNRIATLPQLKQVLGTDADITVFRKLKELLGPKRLHLPVVPCDRSYREIVR